MTIDELKNEAKKQGYRLVKKSEHMTLLPCPRCGSKKIRQWFDPSGTFRKCQSCGFKGISANSNMEAKRRWNDVASMINCEKQNQILDKNSSFYSSHNEEEYT